MDAGALAHAVDPDDLAAIEHIVLTHAHLDHTLGLPFALGRGRFHVWGLQATLDAVRENLLNGRIWPDLSDRAVWVAIEPGRQVEIGPWRVEAFEVLHTGSCLFQNSYEQKDRCLTKCLPTNASCGTSNM